jgi:hypothetical protein
MTQKNFSKQAKSYAAYRPEYPGSLYKFIFSHLKQSQTAWDAGTGSGQSAAILANHFTTVHASDISAEQLTHAIKKPNIIYAEAPSENSGYPSNSFDLVTAAQAIHWFDFDAFYEEVRRVARKHALIAVFGYGRLQSESGINPVIQKLYDLAFQAYFSSARRFVEEHYQTIPFPFEEIPAPAFSIETRWTMDQLKGYFDTWSAVQKFISEKGYNPADDAILKIRKVRPNVTPVPVRFPVFLRLGKVCSL